MDERIVGLYSPHSCGVNRPLSFAVCNFLLAAGTCLKLMKVRGKDSRLEIVGYKFELICIFSGLEGFWVQPLGRIFRLPEHS